MKHYEPVHHSAASGKPTASSADPITTEVVRHALNSAANQMKHALVRTSFSPIIYEVLDFAVAIYDKDVRLLAQAPSLPMFMGTLDFCIKESVAGVGGVEALEPGDILLYNWPYGTGSHPQDVAMVMPVFDKAQEIIGYTAIKGHWLDIGAKDVYCTDTVDVFQEGTVFPGVKLVSKGKIVRDIYRFVVANTRIPKMVEGDMNATIIAVRAGANALQRVFERFGPETFWPCVEEMYNHGERVVRSYFEKIPDGRYVGNGVLDNNGIETDQIPFEVVLEVSGSNVRIDFSNAPPQQKGPINCPVPSTLSASRVAISMLAGFGEPPNEGMFRALEIVTRPGTLFHPLSPAPCYLYGWPALQSIEVIYNAISKAIPDAVPASSGGCILGISYSGWREGTEEPWADGAPHPTGQGAWKGGDGGTMLHISESATRFAPLEVWEQRDPWITERMELAQDSCGPGTWRGGPGIDFEFRFTEQINMTAAIERAQNNPWGLAGGGEARPNGAGVVYPDGRRRDFSKVTRLPLPAGTVFTLRTGGGGGYGPSTERPVEKVLDDLRDGYISEAFARRHYPQAFKAE
ncbi:MAG: hydantoinase B/oxoprolinase family protein [Burkholderiaceae bacterium]|nr:hydantoinase B/oxoprolinase family protein [Burkholderiaceae bacterium]